MLEILPFSKSISSTIFRGSGQVTADFKLQDNIKICTGQIFDICPSFSHDFELEESAVSPAWTRKGVRATVVNSWLLYAC